MTAVGNVAAPRTVPLKGVRGLIAKKMCDSLAQTAQLSYFVDVDATATIEARSRWQQAGHAVGPEDLLISVLVRALAEHPELNARATATEAIVSPEIHCSVAISIASGLVAPTIFNAEQRSVPGIAAARKDLVERARAGKLTVPEMTGGTITISNVGATRVRQFTPILNIPQIAILGFGRADPRPWVAADGSLCVRPVLPVSFTADHRFIDGTPAAAFLTTFVELLEQGPALP